MVDLALERATRLEYLLPELMRILYRPTQMDTISDLPLAQKRILRLLYLEPRTVTALGDQLGLTASAVTQIANRLQEAGLVDRIEDPQDRRVKHLGLTDPGRKLMRARQEQRIASAGEALRHIPEARQQAIVDAVEELVKAAGAIPLSDTLSYTAEIEQTMPPAPPYQK